MTSASSGDRLTLFVPYLADDESSVGGGTLGGMLGRFFFPTSSASDLTAMPNSDSTGAPRGASEPPSVTGKASINITASVEEATKNKGKQVERAATSPGHMELVRVLSGAALPQRLGELLGARRPAAEPTRDRQPASGRRLLDYNRSDFRQYWMPDSRGKQCYDCHEKFTTFRRRHHCRICGQLFCARCSNQQISGHLLGYMGDLRLCSYCSEAVSEHLRTAQPGGAAAASELATRDAEPVASAPADAADAETASRAGSSRQPSPPPLSSASSSTHQLNGGVATIAGGLVWPEAATPFNFEARATDAPSEQNPSVLSIQNLPIVEARQAMIEQDLQTTPTDDWEPDWLRSIVTERASSSDFGPRSQSFCTAIPREDVPHAFDPLTIDAPDTADDNQLVNFSRSLPLIPLMVASPVGASASGGGVITPMSAVSPTAASQPQLRTLFESQAARLLRYVLERERLDAATWLDVLWPLARKIAFTVQPNARERKDDMDILSYVHVKMLLSCQAEAPQAQVVFGTVCAKSVADSRMKQTFLHPTVLVVAGAVEYERVAGRFCSIDPIIMQETEYLKNLVHRVASRRPSIIVVEKSVARLALKFLRRAGVTVVCNVKRSVLRRIARCTQADVCASIDGQVTRPRLGSCGSFRSEVVPLLNGDVKPLIYFEDCQPDLACSILLYGASARSLRAAKRVVRFLVSVLYSAKLETELLRLGLASSESVHESGAAEAADCPVCVQNAASSISALCCVDDAPDADNLHKHATSAVLTASPFVDFGLPFIETAAGAHCKLLGYFKQPLYRYGETAIQKPEVLDTLPIGRHSVVPPTAETTHPFVHLKPSEEISTDSAKSELANYRAQGSKLLRRRFFGNAGDSESNGEQVPAERPTERRKRTRVPSGPIDDVLNPYHHQRIAVLFSSYSSRSANAPLFCVRPWVVWMEFYGLHDMPLGEFLRKYCFNPSYKCPSNNCDVPMLDHVRKIVQRNVCVEISVQSIMDQEEARADSADERLIAWDWCSGCKATTTAAPLTNEMWHVSFAKYLEYLCNGRHLCSVRTDGTDEESAGCSHCLFHQHDHYFAWNNYVACFKVARVQPFEVSFSPMVCSVEARLVAAVELVTEAKALSERAGAVFGAMLETVFALPGGVSLAADLQQQHDEAADAFRARMTAVQEMFAQFAPIRNRQFASNDALLLGVQDKLEYCKQSLTLSVARWNLAIADASQTKSNKRISQLVDLDKNRLTTAASTPSLQSLSGDDLQALSDSEKRPAAEWQTGDAAAATAVPAEVAAGESTATPKAAAQKAAAAVAEALAPLQPAFALADHYSLPFGRLPVVVRDGDYGSVIGYALASADYEQKRKQLRDLCGVDGVAMSLKMANGAAADEQTAGDAAPPTDGKAAAAAQHVELQFFDATAKFYCKVYFAEHFRMLRKLLFADGEDAFVRSLGRTEAWHPAGGKSGASFFRTADARFVFKQMSRFEIQSFLKFAPNYFHYVSTAATENKLTALAKIYGVYRIGYRNLQSNVAAKMDVIVMEYLFYNRNISKVYDLKGSMRNRMTQTERTPSELVLLDENLLTTLWTNQQYLHPHSKAALTMAISNDSHFLAAHALMDYSLLVGVDEERREMVVGIVDYIRTYTFDKRIETWVKIAAVPGGHLPTIISPELYCTRFSEAIETYFPVAPDQWTGLGYGIAY